MLPLANKVGDAASHLFGCLDAGANTLTGLAGNDTYYAARGMGTDTLVENDSTSGNIDAALFLAGVATDHVWFRQVSNHLEASIIGTSDKFLFQNWYSGSQYRVEQFKTSDGNKTLLDSQVQNLVNTMAGLSTTPPATTSLPTDSSYDALRSMIGTSWQ